MPLFEFDHNKSTTNLKKHGINFEEAQLLWLDSNLIEIKAKSEDEPRYIVIAQLDRKLWSAVITHRYGMIRIISVRRARKSEVTLYES